MALQDIPPANYYQNPALTGYYLQIYQQMAPQIEAEINRSLQARGMYSSGEANQETAEALTALGNKLSSEQQAFAQQQGLLSQQGQQAQTLEAQREAGQLKALTQEEQAAASQLTTRGQQEQALENLRMQDEANLEAQRERGAAKALPWQTAGNLGGTIGGTYLGMKMLGAGGGGAGEGGGSFMSKPLFGLGGTSASSPTWIETPEYTGWSDMAGAPATGSGGISGLFKGPLFHAATPGEYPTGWNLLGGAGGGYLGNVGARSTFNLNTPGTGMATDIGSGIGGAAGYYFGGPIGAAAGSYLGGGIGALGNKAGRWLGERLGF